MKKLLIILLAPILLISCGKKNRHHYYLNEADNDTTTTQDTEVTITMIASKQYSPSRSINFKLDLKELKTLTLPSVLQVVSGCSGNHTATIKLDNTLECTYKGASDVSNCGTNANQLIKGIEYKFESCNNGQSIDDTFTASLIELQVNHGSSNNGETIVMGLINAL